MGARLRVEAFADRLRALRDKAELTQAAVGERVGVDRSAVACWELGLKTPGLAAAVRLARVYGQTVEQLVAGTDVDSRDAIPRRPAGQSRRLRR